MVYPETMTGTFQASLFDADQEFGLGSLGGSPD